MKATIEALTRLAQASRISGPIAALKDPELTWDGKVSDAFES